MSPVTIFAFYATKQILDITVSAEFQLKILFKKVIAEKKNDFRKLFKLPDSKFKF